jgi:hypothetical protein
LLEVEAVVVGLLTLTALVEEGLAVLFQELQTSLAVQHTQLQLGLVALGVEVVPLIPQELKVILLQLLD